MLVVIPVWDSALSPDGANGDATATPARHVRQRISQGAWEGLALGNLTERGFSFRAMVVGLHEFESRSRAAAAAGEGLVFAGKLEEACSRELGEKLADLSGASLALFVAVWGTRFCNRLFAIVDIPAVYRRS